MKINRYSVIWRNRKGECKFFESDDMDVANRKAILKHGTMYVQLRYYSMLRLQRRYIKLRNEGRLPETVDYPQFIETA